MTTSDGPKFTPELRKKLPEGVDAQDINVSLFAAHRECYRWQMHYTWVFISRFHPASA
jgi:hypothetical protein